MIPQWVSIADVLAAVPISKRHLFRLLRDGTIRSTRVGRRRLVDPESVNAYLAKGSVAPTPVQPDPPKRQRQGKGGMPLKFKRPLW